MAIIGDSSLRHQRRLLFSNQGLCSQHPAIAANMMLVSKGDLLV
jgi:hypothetical protein